MTAAEVSRTEAQERAREDSLAYSGYRTDLQELCEKARATGLDERQIALAQMIPHGAEQEQNTHEAYMRVAIHALAFDHPGEPVCIPRYGIGLVPHADGSMTLWRRR
jgi:hypothetical protein